MMDGEAAWWSDKLKKVREEWRADYFYLHPLALANGSFECDTHKIWSGCYAYMRPSITEQTVCEILDEFWDAKLLFCWTEPDGKIWGFWVGIDKPGRLPKGNALKYDKAGQPVPKTELDAWLQLDRSKAGERPDSNRIGLGRVGKVRIGREDIQTSTPEKSGPVSPILGPVIQFKSLQPPFSESQSQSPSQVAPPSHVAIDPEKVFDRAFRRFRHHVGKSLGTWNSCKPRQSEWSKLIKEHGEDLILAAIELWARENKDFLRTIQFPLAHFLKNAKQFIAEAQVDAERGEVINDSSNQNSQSQPNDDDDDYARMLKTFPELAQKKAKKA